MTKTALIHMICSQGKEKPHNWIT